ncbi:cation diffusion facilitator family transporter [Xanthomonas oryzae]|uniref:Cation diffusion facilitator family transporter n=1 Tax=Xanthomonas oryzae pv. oryzae TaxID=64187 RepID=A0AAJ5SND8_XANOO|nr:cation diffusion facilitator family transporter [Xanthomonas oryzae]AXM42095.1 cation transporter [Xanthomonas oryzae pv. oryzae]OLG52379.1 cation diffusion facilitator family transporter [Xanthomonas oryzae pv. oryzae]OLI45507.1 cation diffusion facilitator family transporter [Xanthomonas oryzae pv. oryzae]OLI92078.1 cation diffusion facilitator family transporter [Xanthomonas oryzae pv. oryzae]OLK01146.1 cation diffusion facilitator family transporter [Xanthomonas oryzae pv. oryzae]
MGHDHNHAPSEIRHETPLWWALGLTATFLLAEIIGAFVTNSLALLSDAAHMATDTVGLMIALVAVRLSRRPADARRTYGYVRLEALGALANGALLFAVGGYILWEAAQRVRAPQDIAYGGMLLIAGFGLVINLIAMKLLHAGSGESLNVKGAYLEVWSDMLGSVAVIIGALLIHWTGWQWIDPVLAVLIGLWVLPRTWVLLREAINVLLEGVPKGIDLAQVQQALTSHPGVEDVHDLHVWALASSTPALTAHIVVNEATARDRLRDALATLLHDRFDIVHVTLQVESGDCGTEPCGTPKPAADAGHDAHHGHSHAHGHSHH